MMFILGVVVGVIITVIAGIFVLAWVCDRAYELGKKDEKEGRKLKCTSPGKKSNIKSS